ncbi:MAG: hypothetical protein EXS09_14535 [Gemmataceae bacterium]|nr:hypothetical protein [Gemmataceae bacterium]
MNPRRRASFYALALLAIVASFPRLHAQSELASSNQPPVPASPDEPEIRKLIAEALQERDDKTKEEAIAARKVTGTWKNGITFETGDKNFRFTIGGVNQFDIGFYGANRDLKRSIGQFNNMVDPGQTLQDGMDFRRARLRMSGLAYEQIEFFA